jgi:hypothetical protein
MHVPAETLSYGVAFDYSKREKAGRLEKDPRKDLTTSRFEWNRSHGPRDQVTSMFNRWDHSFARLSAKEFLSVAGIKKV